MSKKLRLAFMGTPDFAATILHHLAEWQEGEIVGVWSQPDRPSGRGHKVHPSAVKEYALQKGYPVFQPLNFREEADCRVLADLQPDVLLVAAYGLLLPQRVLDIPKMGAINVHASLLPSLRGAAPIQRAIMSGDKFTGITLMQMEKGLDTGAILLQRVLAIGLNDTADTLTHELAELGGRLLVDYLKEKMAGTAPTPIAQNSERASYAKKIEKTEGNICWDMPVLTLHAKLRSVTSHPGARTLFLAPDRDPLPIILNPGEIALEMDQPLPAPGTIAGLSDGRLVVACADAFYLLSELKPAGGHMMNATAFWNGYCRGQTEGRHFAVKLD